jgi:hypothetical protein
MKYTAGPWVSEPGPDNDLWVLSDNDDLNEGHVIASIQGPDKEGNAALIAAAPDLLAACRFAHTLVSDPRFTDRHGLGGMLKSAIDRAMGSSYEAE